MMNEILTSLIGAVALVAVALIETSRRVGNKRWEQNRSDHSYVVEKIEDLGNSLGRSIDRVEVTALRTEHKLDQHINDHVTGKLSA